MTTTNGTESEADALNVFSMSSDLDIPCTEQFKTRTVLKVSTSEAPVGSRGQFQEMVDESMSRALRCCESAQIFQASFCKLIMTVRRS